MTGVASRHPWRVGVVVGAVLLIDVAPVGPIDRVMGAGTAGGPWGGPVAIAAPADAAGGEDAPTADAAEREAAARHRAAEEAFAAARSERRTAERTLQQRAQASERAQQATLAIDRGVRTAERQIVAAVVARWESAIALEQAQAAATSAEASLRRHRAVLVALRHQDDLVGRARADARARLDERTITAYKHGSVAASTGWVLGAAREASSPGDLAAVTKHLERLSQVGHLDVELLEAVHVTVRTDLAQAATRRDRAVVERDRTRADVEVAHAELARATDEVAAAETVAADRRVAADGTEAMRLAGWQRALEAEAAAATRLEALQQREADARRAMLSTAASAAASADTGRSDAMREVDDTGDADAAADAADEGSLEDRRDWLRARQRSLQRNRALAAEARYTDDAWVCPVVGGRFANDWGFPRSQLRRHQGTDVFAPDGTPVLSPVDGIVSALDAVDRFDGRRDLGGITVTVQRGSERFYHAHLQGIAPGLRVGDEVVAGTTLGAVGRTGNARGTAPHLHVGWYVDEVAVNPYASLALACGDWQRPGAARDDRPDP